MDTGIEGTHPDLTKRVSRKLSKSFITDIPKIDGPCKEEKDKSCKDPVLTDPGGHGTWVASAIAASYDGFGISGVAPGVKLVDIRAIQDSGYIFVQPFVDSLTYAADHGIDVVNMSFFIDPWLFNCPDNPADSAQEQMEQATIIESVQRTVDYARDHGVTLVAALGNEHGDIANPSKDTISPDYPPGSEKSRNVDNSCLQLPTEATGVIGVTALGPSERKSYYSNWGLGEADVAGPGGDEFDPDKEFPLNMLLGATSKESLKAEGRLNKKGKPTDPFALRRCPKKGRCGYYSFGQGTSFSSPIVAGVAALIVSVSGTDDGAGGLTMAPDAVEAALFGSSTPHDCPSGGKQEYPELEPYINDWRAFTATCETGPGNTNSFYGHGIVSALNAVSGG
jgi:subtilisin family serine protease